MTGMRCRNRALGSALMLGTILWTTSGTGGDALAQTAPPGPADWRMAPTPTTESLTAVALTGTGTGWAVGAEGTLLRLEAGTWRPAGALPVSGDAVLHLEGDAGWLVFPHLYTYQGFSPNAFFRLEGRDWRPAPAPIDLPIYGMAIDRRGGDGWAVGGFGAMMRYRDGTWTRVPTPVHRDWMAVAAGRDGAWAGGLGGLYRFDGATWRAHPLPAGPPAAITALHRPRAGPGAGGLWVGTGAGAVLTWDGKWRARGVLATPPRRIAALGPDAAWVLGLDGTLHLAAGDRTRAVPILPRKLRDVACVSAPGGPECWAVGEQGLALQYRPGRGGGPAPLAPPATPAAPAWVVRPLGRVPQGYGIAAGDVDGDRAPDLYLVSLEGLNHLYRNRGDGTFADVTLTAGVGGTYFGAGGGSLQLSAAFGDIDNDGDLDLFLGAWGGASALYRNRGNQTFQPVPAGTLVGAPTATNAGVFADVDGDGDLDLFCTGEEGNALLRNDGTGRFAPGDRTAPTAFGAGGSQGAAFGDVDQDGDPDLFVANWNRPSSLFLNDGQGGFTDVSAGASGPVETAQTPVFLDWDNDGDLDLFVATRDGHPHAYRNRGNGTFEEVTKAVGIESTGTGYGAAAADFNQDGWIDLYVGNFGQDFLYLNDRGTFRRSLDQPVWTGSTQTTGVAVADLDRDGDPDLAIASRDGTAHLCLNPSDSRRHLTVRVEGVAGNRTGIGARVAVYAAGRAGDPAARLGTREITASGGYFSTNEPVARFGLPTTGPVDVEVRFPGGRTILRPGVTPPAELAVAEATGWRRALARGRQGAWRAVRNPVVRDWAVHLAGLGLLLAGTIWLGARRYAWPAPRAAALPLLALGVYAGLHTLAADWSAGRREAVALLPTLLLLAGTLLLSERTYRLNRRRAGRRAALAEFSRGVTRILSREALTRLLFQTLDTSLEPTTAALLVGEDAGEEPEGAFRTIRPRSLEDPPPPEAPPLPASHPAMASLTAAPGPLEGPALQTTAGLGDCPAAAGAVIAFPLRVDDRLVGALFVGAKRDGRPFHPEERDLLGNLAAGLAVALRNIQMIRELSDLNQALQAAESQLKRENLALRRAAQEAFTPTRLIAVGPAMREVRDLVDRAAAHDMPVLLTGESGTGKDVVARTIHFTSPRRDGPFVPVDCGALAPAVAESELFGHVRGAFTGAETTRTGLFAAADGGTLFLDEVGNLPPSLQAKLLRTLQEGTIRPVGDSAERRVETRIIAATNEDLPAAVEAGRFREDLYYRLNVFPIPLPALRDRPEDLPALAQQFCQEAAAELDRPGLTITPDGLTALQGRPFPGNLRELRHLLLRAAVLTEATALTAAHFQAVAPPGAGAPSAPADPSDRLFASLREGGGPDRDFWHLVRDPFHRRELSRNTVQDLIRLALAETGGRYRDILPLFHLPTADYRRFMNFLRRNGCWVDFKPFRG